MAFCNHPVVCLYLPVADGYLYDTYICETDSGEFFRVGIISLWSAAKSDIVIYKRGNNLLSTCLLKGAKLFTQKSSNQNIKYLPSQ